VVRFFTVLDEFIRGNYGAQSVLQAKKMPGRKRRVTDEEDGATWTSRAWARFSRRIRAIAPLFRDPRFGKLKKALGDPRQATALLAGWSILCAFEDVAGKGATPEAVARLITTWRFDRRLAGLLALQGYGDFDTLYREVLVLSDLSPLQARKISVKNTPLIIDRLATAVLETLASSPAAPVTLGVNTFGGVRWFNKERAEHTLPWIALSLALFSEQKIDLAERVYKKLKGAERNAEYKLDAWLQLLQRRRNKNANTKQSL
jgi:hypothetical protein